MVCQQAWAPPAVNGSSILPASPTLLSPEPRVGATIWGGRGGVNMAPLSHEQTGVWKGYLYDDDPSVSKVIRWERLAATNEQDAPVPRSYHASMLSEVSSSRVRHIHTVLSMLFPDLHSCRMSCIREAKYFALVRSRNQHMDCSHVRPGCRTRWHRPRCCPSLPDEPKPVILRFGGPLFPPYPVAPLIPWP
jgi:hypothetical protein